VRERLDELAWLAAQSGTLASFSVRKSSSRRAARAAAPGAWRDRLCAASSRRLAMLTTTMATNGTPSATAAMPAIATIQI
jgi:hypothetical protein